MVSKADARRRYVARARVRGRGIYSSQLFRKNGGDAGRKIDSSAVEAFKPTGLRLSMSLKRISETGDWTR